MSEVTSKDSAEVQTLKGRIKTALSEYEGALSGVKALTSDTEIETRALASLELQKKISGLYQGAYDLQNTKLTQQGEAVNILVTKARELKAGRDALAKKVTDLESRITTLTTASQTAKETYEKTISELKQMHANDAEGLQQKMSTAAAEYEAQIKELTALRDSLSRELGTTSATLRSTSDQLSETDTNLQKAQADLQTTQTALEEARSQIATQEKKIIELQSKLAGAESELSTTKSDLQALQNRTDKMNKTLEDGLQKFNDGLSVSIVSAAEMVDIDMSEFD
jgi:chromosome segregation ATPase